MIEAPRKISMINLEDQSFIITKEYRKFAEFCAACTRNAYIGLCYGPPGVGKTFAANHFTHWDFLELWQQSATEYYPPVEVRKYDSVLYTPDVAQSPKEVTSQVRAARFRLQQAIIYSQDDDHVHVRSDADTVKLIIVDEADRLSALGLETLRALSDREKISVIFIGMPGLEKRLASTRSCTPGLDLCTSSKHSL